jgi:hypothetical protein
VFKDASNNINGTFVGNITGNVTGNTSGTSGSTTGNAATATALETARTIGGVSFDGTGNINLPGVNTSGNQDTSGNAATATTLETAREINGTSFNGSANITVTAAAGTLTGSTLNSTVTASSLTSLGTLASNLNLGGQDIVTTASNQDIDLAAHGTGKVVIKGNDNQGAIKLNCEANSHGQTIIAAPHSETANNTLTLPSTGGDARLVTTSSTATFTNKTFDVEGTGNSISNIDVADLKSGVLDTDISSVSGSDDTLASAKAIKTYVDAQVTAQDLDLTTDSGTIAIDLDSETLTVTGGTGIDTSASGNEVTIAGSDASTSSKGIASFSDTFFSVSSGAVSLDAAQTGITSLTNASLVIGRDADNDIDFSTDNQITFRANGADQIKLTDGALAPVTDNDIDLGTSSLEFKNAFFDGTVTADAFAGPLTGDVTGNVTGNVSGTAATVTGAAQSNITSLGTLTTLTVDNVIVNGTTIGHTDDTDLMTLASGVLTVAGTLGATDSVTITSTDAGTGDAPDLILYRNSSSPADSDDIGQIFFRSRNDNSQNVEYARIGAEHLDVSDGTEDGKITFEVMNNGSLQGRMDFRGGQPTRFFNADIQLSTGVNLVFEGATANTNETTLTVADPTADRTVTLPDATGTVITTGNTSDITTVGTLTTLTVDNVIINGSTIGHTGDTDLMTVASGVLTVAGEVDATSLDISGDADIDGTLEADAITVNGTALNTVIADEATALAIALG